MKALVLPALVLSLVASMPLVPSADARDDFTIATIRFDIAERELIPHVVTGRVSCDVLASGESLVVLASGSTRSTLEVSAGPCSIVLVVAGLDVEIPVLNATPLGTRSFFLPGLATLTLGIVDVSVDLVTSLHSTTRIEDAIGAASPRDLAWTGWGVQRIQVDGHDGFGSVAASHLRTEFTYRMALGISVFALGVRLYHHELAEFGSPVGTPSLRTPFAVDLRPHALVLEPVKAIRHDGATLSWSGPVDSDVDHLELWLSDGHHSDTMTRLPASASEAHVLLRPATSYRAWVVAVDGSGQVTPSNEVAFESAQAPAAAATSTGPLDGGPVTVTLVVLGVVVAIAAYAVGFRRGRTRD